MILPLYMQLYNFIFKLFIDVIKKKLLFLSNIKSRMLQRIQTLYLLLAAICSGGLSQFLPVRNTEASIEFAFDSIEYMILFSASRRLKRKPTQLDWKITSVISQNNLSGIYATLTNPPKYKLS